MKQLFLDNELFTGTEEEFLAIEKFCHKKWKLNGKLHRDGDNPAIIYSNGSCEWWRNGKKHRDGDDPSVINEENGYLAWYKNGQPHRIGGPATIFSNGDRSWYKNGKLHRIDGPALVWGGKYNKIKNFYIEGEGFATEEEFNKARASYSLEGDNPILEFLRDEFEITSSCDGIEKLKQIKKIWVEFENFKKHFQD